MQVPLVNLSVTTAYIGSY